MEITSTKPYLLRAIFEWAEDNGFTPQVLVNAEMPGVEVPRSHVVDGQIVLNISSHAVKIHVMDNEHINFSARFAGVEQDIFLPIDAILAIYSRENSQGIFFEETDNNGTDPGTKLNSVTSAPKPTTGDKSGATSLASRRNKSHLKIIK